MSQVQLQSPQIQITFNILFSNRTESILQRFIIFHFERVPYGNFLLSMDIATALRMYKLAFARVIRSN